MNITEALVDNLNKSWEGKVYQSWDQEVYRIRHFQHKVASMLDGMTVMDIGCNGGLQALALDGIAKRYIGIEPDPMYAKQFVKTKLLIRGDAKCYNMGIMDYCKEHGFDFDAVLASYVLYHLSDEELVFLRDEIFPKCKLVVIYTRAKPRKIHKNSYDLFEPRNVQKYLESAGFTSIKYKSIKDNKIHVSIARR